MVRASSRSWTTITGKTARAAAEIDWVFMTPGILILYLETIGDAARPDRRKKTARRMAEPEIVTDQSAAI